MVGIFGGTRDFDPGPEVYNVSSSSGYYDIFVLKLDPAGNFVWAKGFGGGASLGADNGRSIALDNQGYLYTTGTYVGAGDFDPGTGEFILTPIGLVDMFISKMDTDGNFVYAHTFGSITENYTNGYTGGYSILTDNSGNIYCTGYFQNTTDFDPGSGVFNLVAEGGEDSFILKLSQTTVEIAESAFKENIQVYPNPTTGNFVIKFETLQKRLSVQIMSISGQVIETRTFQNTDFIQMKLDQPNGIYVIEVQNEKGSPSVFQLIRK